MGSLLSSAQKIKRFLYSIIEKTGKKNIQVNIISSMEASQKYIDTIIDACMRRLKYESADCDLNITIAILCEALLHFMLTVSTLLSERKVEKIWSDYRCSHTKLTNLKKKT